MDQGIKPSVIEGCGWTTLTRKGGSRRRILMRGLGMLKEKRGERRPPDAPRRNTKLRPRLLVM